MKVIEKIQNLPVKVKKQMRTALLLLCAAATFIVPAFGGGYSALKDESVISSAAAIEDVDLLLVGASAYGEAKKVMNATDPDAKDLFIGNTAQLLNNGAKWQNIGLLIGARDALSGSTYNSYATPNSLSASEVETYGNNALIDAYNKYKMVGFAIQNLNNSAQKSNTASVSIEEGLDAMSSAAIKLGGFGVKFLDDYNPGPVLAALYDIRNLYDSRYSNNKFVKIVKSNDILRGTVELFGTPVGGTGLSFFLILNAVVAVAGFALSMFLTLLGNRNIGDAIRHFLIRIVIGSAGIYIISNILAVSLDWMSQCVLNIGSSDESRYVEENLNLYDWYLTGFALPGGTVLDIDSSGQFQFTPAQVRAINEYTYTRLTGNGANDIAIKERMESYVQNGNKGTASFVTPSYSGNGDEGGEAWATDVYYAIMKNYAENNENGLLDPGGDPESPLNGVSGSVYLQSRYLWMSSLNASPNGDGSGTLSGFGSNNYYGLNPISAFNLVRSDFSGESITATSTVYPTLAYVAFDVINVNTQSASTNMNALTRFIACFTLVLAAFKGLITIFTAGFAGLLSGGAKTALGSSNGLGQALGAVVALVFGVIGISVIMSMTLSLLDTVYGIARELVGDTEVLNAFLQPVQEAVGDIPVLGPVVMWVCRGISEAVMTLVLALTFPKLGGIPITIFAQFMADIPGRMAEKAQMIEGMLLSGRSSAGGGLPPAGGGRGQYGRMAGQMAGQAFQSSTRQAGQILRAGTMAAGALAGASLSAAGKAINKKADALEGKPNNPGVDKWDEMSPEEQAKAAEVAAGTDNWDNMDQDSRQKALEEAGVFGGNEAQSGTSGDYVENAANSEAESVSEVDAPVEAAPEGAESADTIDNGPAVPEVGAEASMNMAAASASVGEAVGGSAEPPVMGTEPGESAGISAGHIEGGGEKSGAPAKGDAVNISNSSMNENTTMEGGDQQLHSDVKQMNKMDAVNVDQTKQLNTEQVNEVANNTLDGHSTNNTTNMADKANGLGTKGVTTADAQAAANAAGTGKVNSGLPTGNGARTTANTQQSGASATYQSVNNNMQAGDSTALNANAAVQQNMQVTGGVDQSNTLNTNQSEKTEQSLDMADNKQAKKAADGGSAGQSMNGTSKSKYGKEMTVKQQKQARALHAVGDGLQMMGGNRSMGQGIREALGYSAEAMAFSVMPPDMMNGFAQDIRNRRQLRAELARRDRITAGGGNNGGGKKK